MSIRIIHVGVGLRGGHWLEYVRDYPDAKTVAVVDVEQSAISNARNTISSNSCGYFQDLSEALKKVEADAVIIASPSSLHAEHASNALKAGLAVMVEKPFTTSIKDAHNLIQSAEQANKLLMIAENFRFVRAERTVRKLMQDKLLGEVNTVTLTDRRRQPASTQGPWVPHMEFAQLREIATHHFDSLRSFFERKPVNIFTQVYNPSGSDYKHGACTKALIELEGGLNIVYLGTLTSHRYSYTLHIEGEYGEIWTNRKRVFFRKKGSRFFWPMKQVAVARGDDAPYPREGTTTLLNSLRDAVLHNKVPETCGRDNIWNVAMVEAALLSAKEGRTINIDQLMQDGTKAS